MNNHLEWLKPKGKLEEFEKFLNAQPLVVVILGARGTGKTALGFRVMENIKADFPERRACTLGFPEELPNWIEKYEEIEETPQNAVVLVSEAGMYGHTNLFLKSVTQARHAQQTLLFDLQNSADLSKKVFRQLDVLLCKKPSMMQADTERTCLMEFIREIYKKFLKLKEHKRYVWVVSEDYTGMLTTELPSFWSTNISCAFRKKKE